MVHGSWFMVHGSWFMVHGSWFMEGGIKLHNLPGTTNYDP